MYSLLYTLYFFSFFQMLKKNKNIIIINIIIIIIITIIIITIIIIIIIIITIIIIGPVAC